MLSLWTEVVAVSEREALGQMARLDNRSGGTGRLLCNRMITSLLELDESNNPATTSSGNFGFYTTTSF